MKRITLVIITLFQSFIFQAYSVDTHILSTGILKNIEASGLQFERLVSPKALVKLEHIINQDVEERRKSPEFRVYDLDLFNSKWLTHPNSFFQLVAVSFNIEHKQLEGQYECGQLRFIYRLRYHFSEEKIQSLPMTAMVIVPLKISTNQCQQLIEAPNTKILSVLGKSFKATALEVNLLSLRVLAPMKPETAGYSEYILRVFSLPDMDPQKLLNTPNMDMSSAEKVELKKWINKNENRILDNSFQVPDKFLATRAISVGPAGSKRLFNYPYTKILGDGVNKQLAINLNRNSCQGCHQNGSLSGFHILGEDPIRDEYYNQLYDSVSAHMHHKIKFRKKYFQKYLAGSPLPNFQFSSELRKENTNDLGLACETGQWKSHEEIPFYDVLTLNKKSTCIGNTMCMTQEIGFPGGYCIGQCQGDETNCHSVPSLMQFTECLQNHDRQQCFKKATTKVLLQNCMSSADCREDYVCANTATGKVGVCAPPYFLFQLNLNGHNLSANIQGDSK